MSKHNILGKEGEEIAMEFLKHKQFIIMERNWRYDRAEIDIIAQKENTIHFVEVKTRSTNYFGHPEEAVNEAKQTLLSKAANQYLEENQLINEAQFDIIAITLSEKDSSIYHIEDAFFPIDGN